MLKDQSSDFAMPAFYDLKDGTHLFTFNRNTVNNVNKFDCVIINEATKEAAIEKLKEYFSEEEALRLYNESVN